MGSLLVFAAVAPSFRAADSLVVPSAATAPSVDGRVDDREYGAASVHIPTSAGEARLWIARHGGFVYVAATLPDSTFYWGDDLVVSLDPDGSADATPQPGDRQWYLRRLLDSSVVLAASDGRWMTPGQPTPMLGSTRHHDDWDVASSSSRTAWTVELRIRESIVKPGSRSPRIAFRTYNDQPRGWWSWPAPASDTPAQRVERNPASWISLVWR